MPWGIILTEKLKPLVIEASIEPQALAGINYVTLSVIYCSNQTVSSDKKSSNNSSSYEEVSFVNSYDHSCNIEQQSKEKCDRAQESVYTLHDLSDYFPTSIQVKFLPSLTTSHLQLMVAAILPMVLNVKTKFVQNTYSDSIEDEESEVNELVVDLTYNTDLMIVQDIETYMKLNNAYIFTKEKLNNYQIVEIMLAKKLEYDQGDPDDSNEELSHILVLEELDRLKNFILFVEQQMNNNFDKNDLTLFHKYVLLM
ncbi:13224_t:CDS:2, partial [Cetraspora pellucida]